MGIFANQAIVINSADLVLNAKNSHAILANYKATINSSNHKIELNGDNTVAYHSGGGNKAKFTNVKITAKNDENTTSLFLIDDDETVETLVLDNVTASMNKKSLAFGLDDSTDITLSKTNIETGLGIVSFTYTLDELKDSEYLEEYNKAKDLNIQLTKNSSLKGRESLLSINQIKFAGVEEKNDGPLGHNINISADDSKLYGKSIISPESRQNGGKGKINFDLKNNSQWTINGDSEVDTLALDNSQVTQRKR